jgi:putative phosphoribosyl transferase
MIHELHPPHETDVQVELEGALLPGSLTAPNGARGLVIFAHGSGSSRLSPRNIEVAQWLNDRGCATLLFDLLTERESMDRRNVFDIPLLAERMVGATRWAQGRGGLAELPIGYFGASTGAAAALVAAAELRGAIAAVVSRGGRPDLAGDDLPLVTAPTLLLVGSRDEPVIEMNREAQAELRCENVLEIIARATHLFEEPGTLEEVARLAGDWFIRHFAAWAKSKPASAAP